MGQGLPPTVPAPPKGVGSGPKTSLHALKLSPRDARGRRRARDVAAVLGQHAADVTSLQLFEHLLAGDVEWQSAGDNAFEDTGAVDDRVQAHRRCGSVVIPDGLVPALKLPESNAPCDSVPQLAHITRPCVLFP